MHLFCLCLQQNRKFVFSCGNAACTKKVAAVPQQKTHPKIHGDTNLVKFRGKFTLKDRTVQLRQCFAGRRRIWKLYEGDAFGFLCLVVHRYVHFFQFPVSIFRVRGRSTIASTTHWESFFVRFENFVMLGRLYCEFLFRFYRSTFSYFGC